MKTLPGLLLPASLLISAPALSAEAPTPPPPAAAHQPTQQEVEQFAKDAHGHAHAATLEESHEQREKIEIANKLTDKKMKALAAFSRESAQGTAFNEALAKSKLSREDADKLSFLPDSYYRARQAARRAEKELAEVRARIEAAKAAKNEPAHEDLAKESLITRRLQEHTRFRDGFLKKLNESSRALVDRYEDEFVTILDEADKTKDKREQEARAAALEGLDEERLSRFLVFLEESAKKVPSSVALAKAKIDPKQVEGLSLLMAEYYNHKIIADADEKALGETRTRLTAARAANKPTAFDERLERYYVDKLARFQTFRKEFSGKYGDKLTELLDKRATEFIAAYQKRHEATKPADE